MLKKIASFLIDNLLLAVVYYLASRLSIHFLTVPPSFATAIWPPAGISLAFVLLRGYRVLPAIFIADLIVAVEIVGFADFVAIIFSLMVGFQAMIAAWIGAYFIRHFVGIDNQLIENKSIVLFLLLAGPVAMVLPAALALGVEYWLGMVESSAVLLGFLTWWLGGALGAIIFAPVTLILLGGQPQRARISTVVIPLSIAFVFLVLLFSYTKDYEHQRLNMMFEKYSQALHKEIIGKVDSLQRELHELKIFLSFQVKLSERDFNAFSQFVLTQKPAVTALAWLPVVMDKERESFEAVIGKPIFKYNNKGNVIEAKGKRYYLPIQFIAAKENYQSLQGFDFSTVENWYKAQSDTEFIFAVSLYQNGRYQKLTALVTAIFSNENSDRQELRGYVVLLLPFHGILNNAVALAKLESINLAITGLRFSKNKQVGVTKKNPYDMEYIVGINKFGHNLQFKYFPDDGFIVSYGSLPVSWVFIMGLGVTGLLGFILLSITGQIAQTKKLVDIKTKALKVKQQLLQTVLDNVQEGIIACDESGRLTVFNSAVEKIFGKSLAGCDPETWGNDFEVEDFKSSELIDRPVFELLKIKKLRNFEFVLLSANKSKVILKVNSSQILNDRKQKAGVVASFQNITQQKQLFDELKKMSWAVKYSPVSVLITDNKGVIEYVNNKFVELTGYSRKEIKGKKPSFLSAEKTDVRQYQSLWQTVLSGNEWQCELLNRKKSGELFWSRQLIAPIANDQKHITHFVALQEDVTEAKKVEDTLTHQANHDELTGLFNRRECEKRLGRVILTAREEKSKHVFCFLDLDHFKIVNDSCGHLAGDYLLQELCEVFKRQVRNRDSLIRMGGDEFGIIMEHCSLDQAFVLADRICQSVADYEFIWEGQQFKVGVSIGLTEITEKSPNYTEVVSQADDACYAAKKAGKGRVCAN